MALRGDSRPAAPVDTHAGVNSAAKVEFLSVNGLTVRYPIRGGILARRSAWVEAVSNVSFEIQERQTLGLVGESGSGKSTIARALLGLVAVAAGSVRFRNAEITNAGSRELRRIRRQMQIVFQDPYSSLDPRQRVGNALYEALQIHHRLSVTQRTARVAEVLDAVGLSTTVLRRFPYEFSGGQRQRIAIARALIVDPSFLVCDEPISALDVSIQAQVINLLEDLRERFGLTYLFIAHDLAVVRHISTRVAVMYLGKLVEVADRDDLFGTPLHPYTKALMSAIPRPNPVIERKRERIVLHGEIPSPAAPPKGCRFHTRCAYAQDVCRHDEPPLTSLIGLRSVACHFWNEIDSGQMHAREASWSPV